MARDKRDEVHIDDNFDMVDVAMAMRRLTSLICNCCCYCRWCFQGKRSKLYVILTGCGPMSVDGGVGIHGLKD